MKKSTPWDPLPLSHLCMLQYKPNQNYDIIYDFKYGHDVDVGIVVTCNTQEQFLTLKLCLLHEMIKSRIQ